ncbi:MAG TPA: hypothetical protein VIN56_10320 [Candidatus Dormibacteraeota bacterium]
MSSSQTIAIILRFDSDRAPEFEKMFADEVLPLWHQFKAAGKFIGASLTPVLGGGQEEPGITTYILHVQVPSADEHHEFDNNATFVEFLARAMPLQPQEPLVWFGNTLHEV